MGGPTALTLDGGAGVGVLLLDGEEVANGSEVEAAGKLLDARVYVVDERELPIAVRLGGEVLTSASVNMLQQQPVVNFMFPKVGSAAGGELVTLQGIG